MAEAYDEIGVGYSNQRKADPRIARLIVEALGDAERVINVGAGTGSYEPTDRVVFAIEPSSLMIDMRAQGSAPVVRGTAERLPFRDRSFDAALVSLSLHHWMDWNAGMAELRRIARRAVIFTFDPAVHFEPWLVRDYLPEIADLRGSHPPDPEAIGHALGHSTVVTVPIPYDCHDGFLHAYWRRPWAYLDPAVQASISGIAQLPATVRESGITRLAEDLHSGKWYEQHRDLVTRTQIDCGYRLVISH
jgi:SAM-dependent methyltransferase